MLPRRTHIVVPPGAYHQCDNDDPTFVCKSTTHLQFDEYKYVCRKIPTMHSTYGWIHQKLKKFASVQNQYVEVGNMHGNHVWDIKVLYFK